MHIVIFNEDEIAFQLAVFAQVNDVLDESLALVVARMRLARKDELDGPLFIMHEPHDVLKLLENQRRTFIRGKAPREANGQRIGIEQVIEGDEVVLSQPL